MDMGAVLMWAMDFFVLIAVVVTVAFVIVKLGNPWN
tara:strand:+ start:72 stop:179 length:108 start_codon:yes stop_codon:yes gene_type:complete